METLTSGTMAGAGSFRCSECGYMLTLVGSDLLSDCPRCTGRKFVRASLFSRPGLGRDRPSAMTTAGGAPATLGASGRPRPDTSANASAGASATRTETWPAPPAAGMLGAAEPIDGDAWLARVRERLSAREEPAGEYLAYEEGGELRTVALTREWTRIGRSLAADVRFDDPTVSRRHALIVRQADGVRVLDDRSLNGVFINGARVEWKVLRDGDEIVVGRYRLRFLSLASRAEDVRRATATAG